MKIAITTNSNNLNSIIPEDFKDSNYFLLINTDKDKEYTFVQNMYNRSMSGAEIFCSNFLIKQEIELFICGEYNDQAGELLSLAGIKIKHMPNTNVRETISYIEKENKDNHEFST